MPPARGGAKRETNMQEPTATDNSNSKGEEHGECHSPKAWNIVQMGSGFVSEVKEKIGPSLELIMGKVSPSVDAARGMFGSNAEQQNLGKRLVFYLVPPSGAAMAFGATLLGAQPSEKGTADFNSPLCRNVWEGSRGSRENILRDSGASFGDGLYELMHCVRHSCTGSKNLAMWMFDYLLLVFHNTRTTFEMQVSYSLRNILSEEEASKGRNQYLSKETLLVNGLFGLFAFKVLGGKFHNLMPSNVIHPGALHSASIPARGSRYANDIEQILIQDIFKRHGCHHCGKRAGECIADHMPPNVVAYGRGWAKAGGGGEGEANSFLARLRSSIPLLCVSPKVVQQRLYPQCTDCMKLQSTALRHGRRAPLVFHFKRGVPEAPHFTGFCIGAMRMDDCGEMK